MNKDDLEAIIKELNRRLKIASDSYHYSDLAASEYHRLLKEIDKVKEQLKWT